MSMRATIDVPHTTDSRRACFGNLHNKSKIPQPVWEALWDPDNRAGRRFYSMGFTLLSGTAENEESPMRPHVDSVTLRMEIQCVCGRKEVLQKCMSRHELLLQSRPFNMYQEFYALGGLDRSHLLADGYTEKEVDAMEARAARGA